MRIIDTHQHVFWHKKNDQGLIADMDEHGIERAWLLTWEIPPGQDARSYHGVLNPEHFRADGTHAGIVLSDCIKARDRYRSRFVLGYCPDPSNESAPALFESAYHMHGVRVCGEWKYRMLINDPRSLELFRKAGELGCPVVLHLDVPYLIKEGKWVYSPHWYGGTVDHLAAALEACPQTTFIGHAPGFWRHISGDADADPAGYPKSPLTSGGKVHAMLDKYPNLMADLSAGSGRNALSRDPEHARPFLIRYADRLLFARDFYGQELHQFLQTLDLPEETARKIYHENALRLVGE